jgi:hypothetical protein
MEVSNTGSKQVDVLSTGSSGSAGYDRSISLQIRQQFYNG